MSDFASRRSDKMYWRIVLIIHIVFICCWTLVINGMGIKLPFMNSRLSSSKELTNAAFKVGISPPWNAPSWVWKTAWEMHKNALPILHLWDDSNSSFVNLQVLWWKAISANQYNSVFEDDGLCFDLLPPVTRWIVARPLANFYPPLHHQNVAIRTKYLDDTFMKLLSSFQSEGIGANSSKMNIDVINFGAGFDTRSLRFLNSANTPSLWTRRIQDNQSTIFYDLDLEAVVAQKLKMFQKLQTRRKNCQKTTIVPQLLNVDLNNISTVFSCMTIIHQQKARGYSTYIDNTFPPSTVIFLFEAVLLYLEKGKMDQILEICRSSIGPNKTYECGYLLFADRFILDSNQSTIYPSEEEMRVSNYLLSKGFQMVDWVVKPGKARHMGLAKAIFV